MTFSDVERQFYESRYSNFVESQNERNAKIRHTERNRSIPDLLSSRKTCPEETIYQLGTLDEHASAEDLLNIVTEFIDEFKAKYGEHVHVLDWALHLDESTPISTNVMCSTARTSTARWRPSRKRHWKHWASTCPTRASPQPPQQSQDHFRCRLSENIV